MLTATANSCNNCINHFRTYLAEEESPLTETEELLKRILINWFALIEKIILSPAHMVPGVETSPDDIFQVIILLWQLLSLSTDTPEISQFKCNCAQLKVIHKV